MNFAFTEEQDAIRESVARFSTDVLASSYRKRDQAGVIERSLIRQLGEMGLLGAEAGVRCGQAMLTCPRPYRLGGGSALCPASAGCTWSANR